MKSCVKRMFQRSLFDTVVHELLVVDYGSTPEATQTFVIQQKSREKVESRTLHRRN